MKKIFIILLVSMLNINLVSNTIHILNPKIATHDNLRQNTLMLQSGKITPFACLSIWEKSDIDLNNNQLLQDYIKNKVLNYLKKEGVPSSSIKLYKEEIELNKENYQNLYDLYSRIETHLEARRRKVNKNTLHTPLFYKEIIEDERILVVKYTNKIIDIVTGEIIAHIPDADSILKIKRAGRENFAIYYENENKHEDRSKYKIYNITTQKVLEMEVEKIPSIINIKNKGTFIHSAGRIYDAGTQKEIEIEIEPSGSIFKKGESLLVSVKTSEGFKNYNIIEKKYTKIPPDQWLHPSGSPFGYYKDKDNLYVHNVTTEEDWLIPDCKKPSEIYTVNNESILWYTDINNQKKIYNLTQKKAIIIEGAKEYSRIHEYIILEYKDSEDKTHLYNLETKQDIEIQGKLYKFCFRAGKEYFAQYIKTDENNKRSLQILNLTTNKSIPLKEEEKIAKIIWPQPGAPPFNECFLVLYDKNKQQILYNATTKKQEDVIIKKSDRITNIFETGTESWVLFQDRKNKEKRKLYNLTTKQYLYLDISSLKKVYHIKKILKVDNELFALVTPAGKSSYLYNITKKNMIDRTYSFTNGQNFYIATTIRHHKKYPKSLLLM